MFLFKRGSIYYLEYFDETEEKKKRVSTRCRSKSEARKFTSLFLEKKRSPKILTNIKLRKFTKEYFHFAEETYSIKYTKSIKVTFNLFVDYIGNPCIKDISNREAEKYILFVNRRAKYSAALYLRTLKSAFNKAIHWGYINKNPFRNIKLPKGVAHIPRTIEEEELNLILSVTENSLVKEIFIIAFNTGMRQSELLNLKWNSVDLKRKIIIIKNSSEFTTKSKKERIIPMNKIVYEKIKKLKTESNSVYVFPNKNNYKFHSDTISHKFKKAVRTAGLSDKIHFHSLRHSFASNLVRKGVSLYVVKELLGHEDISTTQIYAHLDNSTLVSAVSLLSK